MRTTGNLTNSLSKQRLRAELNSHIEEFLHKGGSIEVLTSVVELRTHTPLGTWPAAADWFSLPGTDID
jgi:hypothetical protein